MVFQVGISRLLLNVRTSQMFAAQGQATGQEEDTYLGREIPLKEVMSQQEQERNADDRALCVLAAAADEEARTESPSSLLASRTEYYDGGGGGKEWTNRGDNDADGVRREIRRIHPKGGSALMRRFWWMHRSEIADVHVDIMHADHQGDESGETSTGGVKLSRLGRLDEWL
jgi:hypothetical protein